LSLFITSFQRIWKKRGDELQPWWLWVFQLCNFYSSGKGLGAIGNNSIALRFKLWASLVDSIIINATSWRFCDNNESNESKHCAFDLPSLTIETIAKATTTSEYSRRFSWVHKWALNLIKYKKEKKCKCQCKSKPH